MGCRQSPPYALTQFLARTLHACFRQANNVSDFFATSRQLLWVKGSHSLVSQRIRLLHYFKVSREGNQKVRLSPGLPIALHELPNHTAVIQQKLRSALRIRHCHGPSVYSEIVVERCKDVLVVHRS